MRSENPNETGAEFVQRDVRAGKGVYTFISADRIKGLQEKVKAGRIVNRLSTRPATMQIGAWRATGLAVLGLTIVVLLIQLLKQLL
jgi:hypothetical protein